MQLPPFENDTTIEIKFSFTWSSLRRISSPQEQQKFIIIYNLAEFVPPTKTYIYNTQIAAIPENIMFRVSIKRKTNKQKKIIKKALLFSK